MTIPEMNPEAQLQAAEAAKALMVNTAYEVFLVNDKGSRFFSAKRSSVEGKTQWDILFGVMEYTVTTDDDGAKVYTPVQGRKFIRAKDGSPIPETVATKKDVMDAARMTQRFDI